MEKKEIEANMDLSNDPLFSGAIVDNDGNYGVEDSTNVIEEVQELEQANYDELQSPYRPLIGVSGKYKRVVNYPFYRWRFYYKESMNLDVDGLYPLNKASGTIKSFYINSHWIASLKKVKNGVWSGPIENVYNYGNGKFPYTKVNIQTVLHAFRRIGYAIVTFTGTNGQIRRIKMKFSTKMMRKIDFEFDHQDGITPDLAIDPTSHPIHSEALRSENLTIKNVFERAGIGVTVNPNSSSVPSLNAGADTLWSNNEMHDVMQVYWSRFANIPQWALWTFLARQHEMGSSLGGIMFDSIGPNDRQGTAVFYDSFISDQPQGDPNGQDWVKRMRFWTTVHEMGHSFNLAHSWQKELGNPWHQSVGNEPDALSFMNYPFRYMGGANNFFSQFEFRFSDQELFFLRHAPERFVQQGNANWFDNHGFEWTNPDTEAKLKLEMRVHRSKLEFEFMEPVVLEFKLRNMSNIPIVVDKHCLEDLRDLIVVVKKQNGEARQLRPFTHKLYSSEKVVLGSGKSLFESVNVSFGPDRWYIDEPGYYDIHSCLRLDDHDIIAQSIKIRVAPPTSYDENYLAQDILNQDVARVLHFNGSHVLETANEVLHETINKLKKSAISIHAAHALVVPLTKNYHVLELKKDLNFNQLSTASKSGFKFKVVNSNPTEAARLINNNAFKVTDFPDKKNTETFVNVIGNIDAKKQIKTYSRALANADKKEEAQAILHQLREIFTERGVLQSVINQIDDEIKQI